MNDLPGKFRDWGCRIRLHGEAHAKRVLPGKAPRVAPDLPASAHAVPSAWEVLMPLFQFLLFNLTFMLIFVVDSALHLLPPLLPPPGSLPCWTAVSTSEADSEPSHLHNYMPSPAFNQHFPFCLLLQQGVSS